MAQIFPIDFEEKLTMANWDFILFSDSEDGNKIKKAQYSNLKWEQGDPGTPGADGSAATITVGSVSTLPAGSSATVTNSWTSSAAVLNFGIPEWATWAAGADWQDGNDWAAATITVWTTTTLPAWSSATVTNVWTSQDAILNFGIPKGDSWSWSWDVTWPASSTDWDVVIFDWSTGKLIKDWSVALSTLSSAASLASTAIQPWDDISDLNNDSGFITWITSSDVTNALWYTPYNSTNPDWYTTNTWDVVWPASSTDWHLAVFDWATGKLIKDWWVVPTWFNPWWTATTGYVVTKTANGYEWSAPTEPTVVSGDSGTTYTIKVANADPWSWTPATTITFVV